MDLPLWGRCVVMPVWVPCLMLYTLAVMTLVVFALPFVFLFLLTVHTYREHFRRTSLRSQDRLMDFATAFQRSANEQGWLLVCETIKGNIGDEIWYDHGDQNAALISQLPSLHERRERDLYADDKDRRFDYYGPYASVIQSIEQNVMDPESGTGILVRRGSRHWRGLDSSPRVKVIFCV